MFIIIKVSPHHLKFCNTQLNKERKTLTCVYNQTPDSSHDRNATSETSEGQWQVKGHNSTGMVRGGAGERR